MSADTSVLSITYEAGVLSVSQIDVRSTSTKAGRTVTSESSAHFYGITPDELDRALNALGYLPKLTTSGDRREVPR